MGIIRIMLFGGRRKKPAQSPKPRPAVKTPIKYVRRKFWIEGISYEVKLHEAMRNGVKINGQTLDVSLSEMTRENFETLIDGWYRRKARAAFNRALEVWLPELESRGYGVSVPRLKLFRMRRAWGRCYYTKNLITVNLHLIKAPAECFDYIVLHELCHFVVHNHSKSFYTLLGDILPDWKKSDETLKSFARANRIIV